MTETYHCPICDGTNVCQEETSLWHLNKECTVKNTGNMNDFYWCQDCDEEIDDIVVKNDDNHNVSCTRKHCPHCGGNA